jgi:hypothetical protein
MKLMVDVEEGREVTHGREKCKADVVLLSTPVTIVED